MPDLHDNGPFCCGKASWWSQPKRFFVCSECGKEFPEKLTACKDCSFTVIVDVDPFHHCLHPKVATRQFDPLEGVWILSSVPIAQVNSGVGPCEHFEAKPIEARLCESCRDSILQSQDGSWVCVRCNNEAIADHCDGA